MTDKELKERDCTPIEDFITENFGCPGTAERDEFESGCETFIIGERLKAGMTQEQLAARVGTKKVIYPVSKMDMRIYNFLLFSKYSKVWDGRLVLR